MVAADGTFAVRWTAPHTGEYRLRVRVPVARDPNGFDFVCRSFGGYVRG